jgi:hypothetical protein
MKCAASQTIPVVSAKITNNAAKPWDLSRFDKYVCNAIRNNNSNTEKVLFESIGVVEKKCNLRVK